MNSIFKQDLTDQLKRHEGFRSRPYKCPGGAITIGFGRNLDARGISKVEAEQLLENDIQSCLNDLHKAFPDLMSSLSPNRQMVLINMCFNLGIDGLLTFRNTLKHIRLGDFQQASIEMLKSKWATQVGKRATELSEMMRIG